jgi:hypothetical protein
MAAVYTFDTIKSVNNPKYPKSPETLAKVEKALVAKKIPKAHIDKFIDKMKAQSFAPITTEATRYIQKNMVAKGLVQPTANPGAVEKAMMVALYGPQKMILIAKFDLSVHLKAGNLELQNTDCKGTKKVLFSVAP